MTAAKMTPHEQRVLLLLSPGEREEAQTVATALAGAGIEVEHCADVAGLCRAVDEGAGAALIAEEALTEQSLPYIQQALSRQPAWSDPPLLVLDSGPRGLGAWLAGQISCVTLIDRPFHATGLVTVVQTALRARRRQYELRDLLQEAERARRQREEFLAMLGHELRNPLGAIGSAVQVLNRIGSPAAEACEMRDMIERQAAHLTRLVDDLLDVSRVHSGRITLRPEPTDLNHVARQCLRACEGLIAAQRHAVTFTPGDGPVVVDVDPVRIEQVINNLLTNAIKYTPAGGAISLSVSRDAAGPGDGAQAVIRVSDNGIGIPPGMLDRVFEMFTQGERALDRSQGGVGLGLTLVRRLVGMHGGSVAASSDGSGRGSTFEVRLPMPAGAPRSAVAEGAPAPSADSAPRRPDPPAHPRHVLIVEDGPDARLALGRLLELWGHHVEVAEDGTRGVERAIASRPDVALIDIGLPGLNGYEVARRVRQVLGNRIRLIALTGYGQPDDQERTRSAGFDQHLVKPVNPKLLSRLLSEEAPHPAT